MWMKTQNYLIAHRQLSRINGVRRSNAKTWNFDPLPVTILYQSISHLAWVITLRRSPALPNLVRIRWAVEKKVTGPVYVAPYMLNNFETVRSTQNMSINHDYESSMNYDYESGVALSDTACNKTSLSRKPYIRVKQLLWNAIRKSWSLFQNPSWKCVKRPLAQKTRWRHIWRHVRPWHDVKLHPRFHCHW